MNFVYGEFLLVGLLAFLGTHVGRNTVRVETMTYEESREWVIKQACDAYVEGRIDYERLNNDIDALLHDKTPVDKEGWPIYYDPRLLNEVNY